MFKYEFVVIDVRRVEYKTLSKWEGASNSAAMLTIPDCVVLEQCADEIDYSKDYPYRFGKMWYTMQWLKIERRLTIVKDGE